MMPPIRLSRITATSRVPRPASWYSSLASGTSRTVPRGGAYGLLELMIPPLAPEPRAILAQIERISRGPLPITDHAPGRYDGNPGEQRYAACHGERRAGVRRGQQRALAPRGEK